MTLLIDTLIHNGYLMYSMCLNEGGNGNSDLIIENLKRDKRVRFDSYVKGSNCAQGLFSFTKKTQQSLSISGVKLFDTVYA